MPQTLVVTLVSILALSLGAVAEPTAAGGASPDFICRIWPSAPGCRW